MRHPKAKKERHRERGRIRTERRGIRRATKIGEEAMALQRPQGTLRCWLQNDYGWIALDGFPPRDLFVHLTAFEQAGLEPKVGARLSFDVGPSLPSKDKPMKPRICAINLTPFMG
jgi:cold shock CspA family protein